MVRTGAGLQWALTMRTWPSDMHTKRKGVLKGATAAHKGNMMVSSSGVCSTYRYLTSLELSSSALSLAPQALLAESGKGGSAPSDAQYAEASSMSFADLFKKVGSGRGLSRVVVRASHVRRRCPG